MCPKSQRQRHFLPLPLVIEQGSASTNRFDNSGCVVAKSFTPTIIWVPAQTPQPIRRTWFAIELSYWWPSWQFHTCFLSLPWVNFEGSQSNAFSANSGWVTESGSFSFLPGTEIRILRTTDVVKTVPYLNSSAFTSHAPVVATQLCNYWQYLRRHGPARYARPVGARASETKGPPVEGDQLSVSYAFASLHSRPRR